VAKFHGNQKEKKTLTVKHKTAGNYHSRLPKNRFKVKQCKSLLFISQLASSHLVFKLFTFR